MLTEQQAYNNWQAVITAACRVEVDTVKWYHCMQAGIPISKSLRAELAEHLTHLRHVLDEIECELYALPTSESDPIYANENEAIEHLETLQTAVH